MGSCACKLRSSSKYSTELNLVVIGSHNAGKNTVGNIILGRKTFWQSCSRTCVKKVYNVNNCLITIVRTPGWHKLKESERKTKDQIKESLFENRADAYLLVINMKSETFNGSEQKMLEDLLTARVWNHTVVVFTNGETLNDRGLTIEQYIDPDFTELIQKCGGRYVVLYSGHGFSYYAQGQRVTDAVKRMEKNKYKSYPKDTLPEVQSSPTRMVNAPRLLSTPEINNGESKTPSDEEDNTTPLLQGELLDREIDETEMRLRKLKAERVHQKEKRKECKTQQFIEMNTISESQSPVTQDKRMEKKRGHDIDQKEWTTSLRKILDELLEDDIKKFKSHLQTGHTDEKRIPGGLLEKADRGTLVHLLLKHFGVNGSVIKTRDALKSIPCEDLQEWLKPFLSKLGQIW
ncbi:immune-associated nucleotide-binding protein 6-like [Hypomesus transpacificus]|uniref:immune-associated nucleotide-binding protein 6-like n=1 Tax=Hypomesus transpacificus TaxID=137520 RepID=UPI001F07D459|nr:immune-associated nucleotide-binding protein 6-like [Hypomesus transpacificus]